MSEVILENYNELSAIRFTEERADGYRTNYILYFMSDKMTEEDAKKEMHLHSMGGYDPKNRPYFIVIPDDKQPILQRIRANIYHDGYEKGYDKGLDAGEIVGEEFAKSFYCGDES